MSSEASAPSVGEGDSHELKLRLLQNEDTEDVVRISHSLYAAMDDHWTADEFQRLLETFPDGQIGVEDRGRIVAFTLSLIVKYDRFGDNHTYLEITENYRFTAHDPDGDVLYGIEVCVDPAFQGMRLGRRLYDARKELCEKLNLRAIIAGGRMPGYSDYDQEMTPREYIDQVKRKEIYDPVMTFQLSNDFHVKKVLTNYMGSDTQSKSYATLLEWPNIYYEPTERLVGAPRTVVRVGVVQLQMRTTPNIQGFFDNAEFYIDAVSRYQADFIVFPEYVTVPLMAPYNHMGPAAAMRKLAEQTEEIRDFFVHKALEYNINVVAGSMPWYENERLYNVSYLCQRKGTWNVQYKLHITPNEQDDWGMVGGDQLEVFDTDCGKVGILICYDVEFPELGRILAEKGVRILFVPFSTDTDRGYYRVRHCAQARAIENECYVVVVGSVGNLPKVTNMDLQYAKSAVLSPSDFNFPDEAVVSEATANTEMTLIADVDVDDLKDLHTHGSVRNLRQRRKDLYSVKWGKGGRS